MSEQYTPSTGKLPKDPSQHIHSEGDKLRFGLMGAFDQERYERNKDLNPNAKTEAQRSADMHKKVKSFESNEQATIEQLKSYHNPKIDEILAQGETKEQPKQAEEKDFNPLEEDVV